MALAAEDLYRIGLRLIQEGNPLEAVHYLKLAEKQMTAHYDLDVALAEALSEAGEHEEAEEYLRRCIDSEPERPEAYSLYADLRHKQGRKEESQKMRAWAESRAAKLPPKPKPEAPRPNWEPNASDLKPGDIEFECPGCQNPVLHGSNDLTCPECRTNLMPIRHGRIKANWRLDGEQSFTCFHCELPLNGKELSCPHCHANLITGELSEEEEKVRRAPASNSIRSPKAIAFLIVGFLLLTIGIGQFRTPHTREQARVAWTMLTQRGGEVVQTTRETVGTDEFEPMDTSVEGNTTLATDFIIYTGMVLAGVLVLLLGGLKLYFDR